MPSLGSPPGRLNLRVVAGEAVDISIPILNGDGVIQTSAATPAWGAAAQVRQEFNSLSALYAFNASITAGVVRITASGDDTGQWQEDWARFRYPWDLLVSDPANETHYLCAGWVSLYTTITR